MLGMRVAPTREVLVATRDLIAVRTGAMPDGCFRVDYRRLSDEETADLAELVGPALRDGKDLGHGLRRRERARLESLLEKSADRAGAFDAVRAEEKQARDFAEIRRIAAAMKVTRRQEQRLIAEIGRCLRDGFLNIDTVGALIAAVFAGTSIAAADVPTKISPAAEQALNVLQNDTFLALLIGLSVFMLGNGILIAATGVLPRWLGWVAVAIGIVALTPIGFFGSLALLGWTLVVSVLMYLRQHRPIPATATA